MQMVITYVMTITIIIIIIIITHNDGLMTHLVRDCVLPTNGK